MVVVVLVPSFWAAMVVLVFAGLAWTAVISTLNAELQLFLPVWVRARGLAIYMVNFTGSMTVGALIWGLVAEGLGLQRQGWQSERKCVQCDQQELVTCEGGSRRPVRRDSRPDTNCGE